MFGYVVMKLAFVLVYCMCFGIWCLGILHCLLFDGRFFYLP